MVMDGLDENYTSRLPDLTEIPLDQIPWDDPSIRAAMERVYRSVPNEPDHWDCYRATRW